MSRAFIDSRSVGNAVVFNAPVKSGLANQLRGLTSAMLLAEESGRSFYIHWGELEDMPGVENLSVFFDSPEWEYILYSGGSSAFDGSCGFYGSRTIISLFKRLKYSLFPRHQFNSILCDMVADRVDMSLSVIVINGYYSFQKRALGDLLFYRKRHEIYTRFALHSEIGRDCEEFVSRNFSSNVIGVHIRTKRTLRGNTQNWDTGSDDVIVRENTLAMFSRVIEMEIEFDPDVRIFLATDNAGVCEPLMKKYRDRIIVYPKKTTGGMVSRSSLDDHKAALVDMILLSRSGKIIGTKQSTFSYEAAVIGDVPFLEVSNFGFRQQYRLLDNGTVFVDFRAQGIDAFKKKSSYAFRRGKSSCYKTQSVKNRKVVRFLFSQLEKKDSPVFIDIGAGTGSLSLVARFTRGGRGYALESNPLLFDVLNSNLRLNNLHEKIHAFSIPVRGCRSAEVFGKDGSDQGALDGCFPAGGTEERPVQTLDSFVRDEVAEKVDLISISSSCDPLAVLKGSLEVIDRFSPGLLISKKTDSFFGRFFLKRNVMKILKSRGYAVRSLSSVYFFERTT